MDQAAAKRYKERWQNANEVTLREQHESSSETKLRQSTELLRRRMLRTQGSEQGCQSGTAGL